jgi:hypothetical protein
MKKKKKKKKKKFYIFNAKVLKEYMNLTKSSNENALF